MAVDFSKRYLVLGVGVTGKSVFCFLRQNGAHIRVADSRSAHESVLQIQKEFPSVDLVLGSFTEELLVDIDVLVINPGLTLDQPIVREARARGIEVVGDIELFARSVDCPVIAVTGTNGKSTVVSMLDAIGRYSDQKVLCGGNIGQPALALLGKNADFIVLELSSYQLETTTSLRPLAASILNISEDHMDRYGNISLYAFAKQRVYMSAQFGVWLKQDELTSPQVELDDSQVVSLEVPDESEIGVLDGWICKGKTRLFETSQLGAAGSHNAINGCFAWALADVMGLSDRAKAQGLMSFDGLEHRTQLVAEIDGVKYFNDSKGTNVGAALAALRSMPGKAILLAGGDGKEQDFTPLRSALAEHGRALVTYGSDGEKIAQMARDVLPVFCADSLESAVSCGRDQAQVGDCVLLSPACASFDMFKNYQERGQSFVACVRGLRS